MSIKACCPGVRTQMNLQELPSSDLKLSDLTFLDLSSQILHHLSNDLPSTSAMHIQSALMAVLGLAALGITAPVPSSGKSGDLVLLDFR
jgi:hypothetical protein